MIEKYIREPIKSMIQDNRQQKFEDFCKQQAKVFERMIVFEEIDAFVSEMNTELQKNYQLKERPLTRDTSKGVLYNQNELFKLNMSEDFIPQYERFKIFVKEWKEEIKTTFESEEKVLGKYAEFVEINLMKCIEQRFHFNVFFPKVYPFKLNHKITRTDKGKALYSSEFEYKNKKYVLYQTDMFRHDIYLSHMFNISTEMTIAVRNLCSLFSEMEKELVPLIKQKLGNKMMFEPHKVTNVYGYNQSDLEPYQFSSGVTYLNVKFLDLSDEQVNEFIRKAKNYGDIYSELKSIDVNLPGLFRFVDSLIDGELYSLDKYRISVDLNPRSRESAIFLQTIKETLSRIIMFDQFDILPDRNCGISKRYYVRKDDEFEMNGSNYVIYQFRGRKNTTYYRGYKDGQRLSTHQLLKIYRKRKASKESALPNS
jgi:hypothetical protein